MYYNRRKFIMKNIIIMSFILLLAVFATYHIYYKFQEERNIDYSSDSLDVTFHEKSGDKIDITKLTPVTDAIGLSSNAYALSIKNNLTEPVSYKLKILDDIDGIINDSCGQQQIPKELIKVAIKETNAKIKILNLSEIENNIIETDTLAALGEKKYTIRVWITNEQAVTVNPNLHYHGIIQVLENDTSLAAK